MEHMRRTPGAEGVRLVRAAMLLREGRAADARALLQAGQGPGCALMAAQLAVAAGDAQQVRHWVFHPVEDA